MNKVDVAEVIMWGSRIGIVTWNESREIAEFQYDEKFVISGIQVSPIKMPLSDKVYSFPSLDKNTFKGLPGFLADSLPDKFGNKLIDEWLERQGRELSSFSPVERLCYIGSRGIGALEYKPSKSMAKEVNDTVAIDEMVKLASSIVSGKKNKAVNVKDENLLSQILMIGTSAGGARAKCLIAYNEITGEIKSGQVKSEEGYTNWLLKLDGVDGNSDKEDPDPQGYSKIEYAYYLMAKEIGIEMSISKLFKEGRRSHFMTKRFDRLPDGSKLHMQSLCAIAHYDFNYAGAHSYEQALNVISKIVDPSKRNHAREQMVLRAIYNVIGRNQDDHTKNISFLMDKEGKWRLSPAYDLIYSYNPKGEWTTKHQMMINGKRDNFERNDFIELATKAGIKKAKTEKLIHKTIEVFSAWDEFAEKAGVEDKHRETIKKYLRLEL
jgi:serine/threonine-protein kinase HipA